MNLIRIIAIGLIIYLLLQIFKRWSATKKSQTMQQNSQTQMVRCEVCQLHIPQNEALKKNEKYFCSQEHYDSVQD